MPDRGKAYEGVLALVFGLMLLAWLHGHPLWLPIALGLTLATLVSPWLARLVAWGWTSLAQAMGFVVSRILLGVVFFVVLTPLALLQRALGRDPLMRRAPTGGSAFTERRHPFTAKDLARPW
jgi:predicted PurR-regulated permease PerM